MLPIETRIEIINAMIEKYNVLDVSTIDAEVGGDYSYQTLEVIKEHYDGNSKEIGFLVGSDTLAIFDKWKNWKWIMDNFTVIVYPRIGDNIEYLLQKFPKAVLGTAYHSMEFPPKFGDEDKRANLTKEQVEKLKEIGKFENIPVAHTSVQPYVLFEYSSTQIRALLENFEENYKYLSLMYNDKCLKILEKIYNK